MNRAIDGHTFADSLIVMNGDLEYQQIAGQIRVLTVPVVIAAAKAIPAFAQAVTVYESQFQTFISEFLEGPDGGDAEDEVPETVNGPVRDQKRKPVAVSDK
jgi:hypothetical protein